MLPEIIPNWHPIFVHFTIALLSISTLLLLASLFIKNSIGAKILEASYINLWLGCLFAFVTIAAGWYAYNTVAHDEPSHMAMTNHRNWAMVTSSIFLVLTIWSIKLYRANQKQNFIFIICMIVATLLLSITGWKGGEAVYRYGLGVMSLPNTDSHQHTQENNPKEHSKMHNSKNPRTHKSMNEDTDDNSH
jgi:uncharacterized membrane protein